MIIASMTSWKKRIKTVSKCIYHFLSKQTKKPDIFYLWLSEEEFPKKEKDLPQDLTLIINYFNIKVIWMKDNIYAHKKYEVFKKHNNDYVIILDDDIYYKKDHIEKLIEISMKYNCVSCYYGKTIDFENGKRKVINYIKEPNNKNILYSGLACFPPNTFPLESYNFEKERNLSSPMCDDSWVNAWLIKNNIKIAYYKSWFTNCLIDVENTQKNSLWKLHNSKLNNGVEQKYINMCNVLKILKIDVSKIWPNIHIEKYSTI